MKFETIKTLIIIGLVLVVGAETGYVILKKVQTKIVSEVAEVRPTPTPARPPAPMMKGDKFADSSVSKFAHQIFPGEPSSDAKAAMGGFTMSTKKQADGSTQVTLTPTEAEYQLQTYTVKSGETLYFIEMVSVDDKSATEDANLRDDYLVLVDASGLVK